jgi:hypothetical protein
MKIIFDTQKITVELEVKTSATLWFPLIALLCIRLEASATSFYPPYLNSTLFAILTSSSGFSMRSSWTMS